MIKDMKAGPREKTVAIAETVFEFIKQYYGETKYMPSRRDIAGWLKSSTSVADYYLHILHENKKIEINDRIARGIVILENETTLQDG